MAKPTDWAEYDFIVGKDFRIDVEFFLASATFDFQFFTSFLPGG